MLCLVRGTVRQVVVVVSSCRDVGLSPATSATPIASCYRAEASTLARLPGTTRRKVGMTSNHHALMSWATSCYNGRNRGQRGVIRSKSQNPVSVRLWAATAHMKSELLVIAISHAAVNAFRPCTHRPSHHGSWERPKSACKKAAEGETNDWGEVVTR